MAIQLFTIGFTQKTASEFFTLLKNNGVKKIIDIRINNKSQLAGFAKGSDLEYFAQEILRIPYVHRIDFAPTTDLLKRYRDKKISWKQYEVEYLQLLVERDVINQIDEVLLDGAVLMCSEHLPDKCHRRLLAEYFLNRFQDISIKHLW
ncbi:MAG: DUF488 domain-containing protein [Clostridiaceae bacterium]|jgi:uncharacterized protein (DUF488 family)|nr:DUF488 domain-containing protein [Clostridiaceae bacterium]